MLMIFMETLQLECYAVPELPPSRNPLYNCIEAMHYKDLNLISAGSTQVELL